MSIQVDAPSRTRKGRKRQRHPPLKCGPSDAGSRQQGGVASGPDPHRRKDKGIVEDLTASFSNLRLRWRIFILESQVLFGDELRPWSTISERPRLQIWQQSDSILYKLIGQTVLYCRPMANKILFWLTRLCNSCVGWRFGIAVQFGCPDCSQNALEHKC